MHPVTFVSLGPGEAELITLKGYKTLQESDYIFYPQTILKTGVSSSRALDILKQLGIDQNKLISFDIPMSKERSLAIEAYKATSDDIIKQYQNKKKITIVAEGDACFYSSSYYILENLISQNIHVNNIPGIPAFIASGALAGIHIVKQEEQLIVIPGVISTKELEEKIISGNTIVIMKTSQCEDAIKSCIEKDLPVAYHYFENVGVKGKEFYTLDKKNIVSKKFPYFSLMIIRR